MLLYGPSINNSHLDEDRLCSFLHISWIEFWEQCHTQPGPGYQSTTIVPFLSFIVFDSRYKFEVADYNKPLTHPDNKYGVLSHSLTQTLPFCL